MAKIPDHSSRDNNFGLPRTDFKPLRQENSGIGTALFILTLFIIAGAGGAYWYFYSYSESDLLKEVDLELAPQVSSTEEPIKQIEEAVAQDHSESQVKEEENNFAPTPPPSRGTITKIKRRQGKYYTVINCFIDYDLAEDYAKSLVKKGENVFILSPGKNECFSCVAVAESNTLYEANKKTQSLKAIHGSDVWFKKY